MKNGMIGRALWAVAAASLLGGCHGHQGAKAQAVSVQTMAVRQGELDLTVRTLGQAIASQSVTIVPQVTGILEKVAIHSGDKVKAGQLLYQIDPRPAQAQVAQAQANLRGAIAQMKYDAAQVKAYMPLVRKDYVTQQTFQQAQEQAQSARAAVAADRAALRNAELLLADTTIRAPIAGRVGLLTIKAGSLVAADSTVLTTINATHPMDVQFSLPEHYLGALRAGLVSQRPLVTVWSDTDGTQLGRGPIAAIDNTVDNASATVTARAVLANRGDRLWPDEYLQVVMTYRVLSDALLIARGALQQGEAGPFVYVVQAGHAVMHAVTFRGESRKWVGVSGITAGTPVIVDPPTRLHPGSAVIVRGGHAA
ncbi:MAG: efflux RND transporter periplasmic adaptor subunit [Gammaproteobacteria bacterium]|nr:efflux RND transporter periplasmic adaptor subunit [Gammaproteobacteria bacterium]